MYETRDGGQVEIKAISSLTGLEESQIINYLKATKPPSCGEKVLSPEISEILFDKIKNKEFVE